MNIDAALQALRPRLSLPALRQHGSQPFAVQVEGGPHLELRFIEAVDTLVMVVPLGHLMRSQLREAGLWLLLSNLFLAQAGQPHYAIDPQDSLVCLCCTAPVDPLLADDALMQALHRLLAAWAPARIALQDLHFIA